LIIKHLGGTEQLKIRKEITLYKRQANRDYLFRVEKSLEFKLINYPG